MLRKRQYAEEGQPTARWRLGEKWLKAAVLIVIASASLAGLIWYAASRPKTPDSDILARQGLHWHPELTIFLKGQQQEIPANVGIGTVHNPIHTHDASGVIHLEFEGLVTIDDLRLGQFFQAWNKPLSSTCILDKCNDPDGQVTMTVNGQPSTEFDRYVMRDKDTIAIRFE